MSSAAEQSTLTSAPTPATAPASAPDPDGAGSVDVAGVSHSYRGRHESVQALGPVDLHVSPGEFLVLVGASGCGKSTLLRLIAGFEQPTVGTVTVSGTPPVPGESAGVVFQQPRLFPWRTVGGNVDLALGYAGVAKADRSSARDGLLHRVGLTGTADRKVWEISGGQQQRVAIARALAGHAPLLLLDEPFAALDALTRERLQEDLRAVSHETGRTSVFVTHSADEAVFLGSRIVVLSARPGRVALDLPVDLPRSGVDPDELRGSAEYAALRAKVGQAVKAAAA
jgi:taurine transport system ATP-binding protein